MKNISTKIKDLLEDLSEDNNLLKYMYNRSKEFIPGKTSVYYSGPFWDDEELHAAINTLISGKWLSSGENVHKFESRFSKRFNQRHSVMVNSGSSANLVVVGALKRVLGWKDGDEILMSAVGFPTTLSPVMVFGLKPVFIDIELDTLNLDLNLIEEKITSKTKALFLSPVLGNSVDMDKLMSICEKHNLELILDNCDSLGSKWKGKLLSDYAIASTHSFYPAHHISTGEGGLVSSNREDIVSTCRSLAWWGRDCYCVGAANLIPNGTCCNRFDKWLDDYDGIIDHKYVYTNIGFNLKPLDLQGAIGVVQLEKVDIIHEKRMKHKKMMQNILLNRIKGIRIPDELEHAETSWFGVPIICKDKHQKAKLVNLLESNKIQTRNYFAGNILIHPAYKHLDDFKKYPNSNQVLDRVFFLGCPPHYTQDTFDYIDSVLKNETYNL